MINFAVKSDSNDKNLNYVNIKKCLTKGGMHGIISELSARDTNAKANEPRAVGGVPCKLNNEKHEQTPWTI